MKNQDAAFTLILAVVQFALILDIRAAAVPRSAAWCASQPKALGCGPQGQPYAESICNTDPNVLFCEDFDYPADITCHLGYYASDDALEWYNPSMSQPHLGKMDRSYNDFERMDCNALDIQPAANFAPEPAGSPAGGYLLRSRPGQNSNATGSSTIAMCLMGDCNPATADAVENYVNGSAPSKDIHVRFQMYTSGPNDGPGANWHFPADFDTKTFFLYPNQYSAKTDANYDGGLIVNAFGRCSNGVRIPDALSFRQGPCCDSRFNVTYPNYPAYANIASILNPHNEYCTGNGQPDGAGSGSGVAVPMDNIPSYPQGLQPATAKRLPNPGSLYRMAAGNWYTIEFQYKLSTPGQQDGTISLWVDGVKVYGDSDLLTCDNAANEGDCLAVREFFFEIAWYNGFNPIFDGSGRTEGSLVTQYAPNSFRLIDNYIVSKSYIGPPNAVVTNPGIIPSKPIGLKLTKAVNVEQFQGKPIVDIRLNAEDGNEYYLFKNGEYYSKIIGNRFRDIWVKSGEPQNYELWQFRDGKAIGAQKFNVQGNLKG